VVAITGAGRGIGRAYALELARRGAAVVVNNRDGEPAHAVVAEIKAAGGTAVACVADVAEATSGAQIVACALSEFGSLDAVIANAGINANLLRFPDVSEAHLQEMFAVHVLGTWRLVQAAWPHLESSGHGRVLITTSQAALYGMLDRSEYASAKGALSGMARALSLEGEPLGVKVNVIAPAAATRMTQASINDAEALDLLTKLQPPELVAPMATVLVHDTCPVSGETFVVGGGHVGRVFLAETRGLTLAPEEFTAEAVFARMDAVRDETGYKVPRDVSETGDPELKAAVMERLRAIGVIR